MFRPMLLLPSSGWIQFIREAIWTRYNRTIISISVGKGNEISLYTPDNIVVLWLLYPYRIITLGSNTHNGDDGPWSRITPHYISTLSFPTKIHTLFLFHVCITLLESTIPPSDERTRYAAALCVIMSIPVYSMYCLQHTTSKAQNVTSHD